MCNAAHAAAIGGLQISRGGFRYASAVPTAPGTDRCGNLLYFWRIERSNFHNWHTKRRIVAFAMRPARLCSIVNII
jgi:hypothetical protein